MKKLTVMAAGLLLLVPSLAFPDTFSLRLGYFMPGASTNTDSLWAIELDQMSFDKAGFRGSMLGFGYDYFVSKNLSLAVTLDSYSKKKPGFYLDYVQADIDGDAFAFPSEIYDADFIEHAFAVSSTPLQVSLKFLPLGRKTRLIPFIGGGAGYYFWSVRLQGEMVDFSDPWVYTDPELGNIDVYPVIQVFGKERGAQFGLHAFAGFQIPVGFRATIEAEARYHWAEVTFTEWFQGFDKFDLGGLAITLGFNFWF